MRKIKISEAIGNINEKYINEAISYNYDYEAKKHKIKKLAKWVSVASCFVFMAIIGSILIHISTLTDGGLNFTKTSSTPPTRDVAYECEIRNLDENEIKLLFEDLPISAYALFNKKDDSILGLEGKIGDIKLVVSAPGINLIDTVIDGNKKVSYINGVPIVAGYITTKMGGEKTIIYYATFMLGDCTVYVEHWGLKADSKIVRSEIVDAIQSLIQLENFDISKITK